MSPATTRFFTTPDGTRIGYRDEGAGLPVLALTGLTRSMSDFDHMAGHLPPCRLIRMDYRGRGVSDRTGAATYTLPVEAGDALALLDHLGVVRAAIIGTSRGGLIAMLLAATARARLCGVLLNDVGPVIERAGLARISDYLGRNPTARTHAELAAALPALMPGFANVPAARWLAEVQHHYDQTPHGLRITYDPALRDAFLAAFAGDTPDLWPLFDACAGLPLCLIRGANSDLLSAETAQEMRRRRADMVFTEIPDRAHVPFLDEPLAIAALHRFLADCAGPPP
jgi:pimeloyl-ACP methyl ester carboxylesterase